MRTWYGAEGGNVYVDTELSVACSKIDSECGLRTGNTYSNGREGRARAFKLNVHNIIGASL